MPRPPPVTMAVLPVRLKGDCGEIVRGSDIVAGTPSLAEPKSSWEFRDSQERFRSSISHLVKLRKKLFQTEC